MLIFRWSTRGSRTTVLKSLLHSSLILCYSCFLKGSTKVLNLKTQTDHAAMLTFCTKVFHSYLWSIKKIHPSMSYKLRIARLDQDTHQSQTLGQPKPQQGEKATSELQDMRYQTTGPCHDSHVPFLQLWDKTTWDTRPHNVHAPYLPSVFCLTKPFILVLLSTVPTF